MTLQCIFNFDCGEQKVVAAVSDEQNLLEHHISRVSVTAAASPDRFEISGIVQNRSAHAWGKAGLSPRIGVRHAVVGGQTVSFGELRGIVQREALNQGETSRLSVSVLWESLPADLTGIFLDLVVEGVCWGHPDSAGTCFVPTAPPACRDASARLIRFIDSPDNDAATETLVDVAMRFDFFRHDAVEALRRDLLSAFPNTLSLPPEAEALRAALARDPALRERRIEALIEAIAPDLYPRDLRGCYARLRGEASPSCPLPPLPAGLEAWAAASVIPPNYPIGSFSNALIYALEPGRPLHLSRPEEDAALEWWWISVEVERLGLERPLCNPGFLRARSSAEENSAGFPPLSPGLARLLASGDATRQPYDSAFAAHRCAFAFDVLLNTQSGARRSILGADILRWLATPMTRLECITRYEFLLIHAVGNTALNRWLTAGEQDAGPQSAIAHQQLADLRDRQGWSFRRAYGVAPPPPCNTLRVVGMAKSPTGLGTNLRMTSNAFSHAGWKHAIVDTEDRSVRQVSAARGAVAPDAMLTRPVDIFHLNLDAVPDLVRRHSQASAGGDVFRIGFALWETSLAPAGHAPGLALCDALWVPTRFVADAYRQMTDIPIHIVGKGLDLPPRDRLAAAPHARRPGEFAFLMAYDLHSWIERKNPAAAVRAFLKAFPDRGTPVRLWIKTTDMMDHPGDRTGQQQFITDAAAGDPRITLLNEFYDQNLFFSLIAAADAVVSPHTAEGFGYLPAFAMHYGVPVIVTNYSGTSDFCTEQTAYLVDYRLREIGPRDFVTGARGAWAVIDEDDLAAQMRRCYESPGRNAALTAAGQAFVQAEYSMDALSGRYARSLRELGLLQD